MRASVETAGQGRPPHPRRALPPRATPQQPPLPGWSVPGADAASPCAQALRYLRQGGHSPRPCPWSGRRRGRGQAGGSVPFPGPGRKGLLWSPAPSHPHPPPDSGHIPGQRPGLLSPHWAVGRRPEAGVGTLNGPLWPLTRGLCGRAHGPHAPAHGAPPARPPAAPPSPAPWSSTALAGTLPCGHPGHSCCRVAAIPIPRGLAQ